VVNAKFPKVRFCAIGGGIAWIRDTTNLNNALFLTLIFPKDIALIIRGLIARIAEQPASGKTR
jgi:hypothetical protein